MYEVVMEVDGLEYPFGFYEDQNKANEVAIKVRDERCVPVSVYQI